MTDITFPSKGLDLSIAFLDQNGNPMPAVVTPDSAPIWTNTTPATETLVVGADGLTAHADQVAVGTDTISVAAIVGGTTFSADLIVNVTAQPAVLTKIAIVATPTP